MRRPQLLSRNIQHYTFPDQSHLVFIISRLLPAYFRLVSTVPCVQCSTTTTDRSAPSFWPFLFMSVKSIYVDIVRLIPLPPSPATFLLSPVGLRPPRTLRPFFPGAISNISPSPPSVQLWTNLTAAVAALVVCLARPRHPCSIIHVSAK